MAPPRQRSPQAISRDLEAAYYFHKGKIETAEEELNRPGISLAYQQDLKKIIDDSRAEMKWLRERDPRLTANAQVMTVLQLERAVAQLARQYPDLELGRVEFNPGLHDEFRYTVADTSGDIWHGSTAEEALEQIHETIHRIYGDVLTPNHGHYVWVMGRGDVPLNEPALGPFDLGTAKTTARIAATKGAHDRAVSSGLDPLASSFRIVRRYRAHTGERII